MPSKARPHLFPVPGEANRIMPLSEVLAGGPKGMLPPHAKEGGASGTIRTQGVGAGFRIAGRNRFHGKA